MTANPEFPALSLDEVCDRLLAVRRPLILSHTHPDGDTIGSAAALALLLSRLGKPVAWRCADPLPKRLSFLFSEISVDPYVANGDYEPIAVDVASPAQLGTLEPEYTGEGGRVPLLMIDHHGTGTPFAPHYVRGDAAAAGQIVYDIVTRLVARGDLPVFDEALATPIYAAISSDTGCFRYANATPATHYAAADLLTRGVKADRINRLLFDCKTPEQVEAEKRVLEGLRFFENGRVSAVLLTRADRAGLMDEDFETAVDVARSVAGVAIACALRETGDGVFKASLRSTDANIAEVARAFGGGGHFHAAGCTIEAPDIEQAFGRLLPYLINAL